MRSHSYGEPSSSSNVHVMDLQYLKLHPRPSGPCPTTPVTFYNARGEPSFSVQAPTPLVIAGTVLLTAYKASTLDRHR